jgi:hypothetical protein
MKKTVSARQWHRIAGTTRLHRFIVLVIAMCYAAAMSCRAAEETADGYFRIHVIDQETGRGVPLAELTTTDHMTFVTDSHGLVAFDEPGLMGEKVWFFVRSHGYECPPDGFGLRGFAALIEPGGRATLKIVRRNIAERLYRATGQGIYRDTVRLGESPPIARPLLNGGVMGQDSICTAIYRDRLYWFWGDTSRASYPLGHFGTAGAISALPQHIDPSNGVDLEYFVGTDGFSRPTYDTSRPGPMWMGSLFKLVEGDAERLLSYYMRVRGVGDTIEHGIAVWNDKTDRFERRAEWPLDAPVKPQRHVQIHRDSGGAEWLYFCSPFPLVRVRARMNDVLNPEAYEAYTCLRARARDPEDVERDSAGRLVWGWKPATPLYRTPTTYYQKGERPPDSVAAVDVHLVDVDSGRPVLLQSGSVSFNEFRRKWVMVANQMYGDSMLGEVWYAEADTLLGPWAYARKVVTHDNYSFYNVMHHGYFDQEGGRLIYFEGTYTTFAAADARATPRYDYNQIMYRLDLADVRLALPEPVCEIRQDAARPRYAVGGRDVSGQAVVKFYAIAPGRHTPQHVAVGERPLFYGIAPGAGGGHPSLVPLFAYRDEGGIVAYGIQGGPVERGWTRDPEPVCLVWRNPAAETSHLIER